ncbi:MAG: hypothetical protein ACOCUW_04130 [Gemmatimonadota bacterium]
MNGVATGLVAGLAVWTIACGTGSGAPAEPPAPPATPDLAGARVMLVPPRPGEPDGLERELVFWLEQRGVDTDWILPATIRRTVERNPASGFDLDAARRVGDTGGGYLRVRDPLYGDLRRLSAILDAPLALVPLGARERTDSLGTGLELTAVLVTARGGAVVWMHTVRAGPEVPPSERVATVASELARTLFPREG